VWLQTLNELPSGTVVVSDERAFVPSVGAPPRQLTSSMVHIGWGDAHLITMPTSGKRVLMDAGETGAAQAVAGWFAQKGIDDLDAVVVSHVHADHIGGMVGVDSNDDGDYEVPGILASFDPETYIDSPSKVHYRSLYAEATNLMSTLGVERVVVERGDDNESFPEFASWDPAVRVLCLNSGLADDVPVGGFEGTNINNESICLRFSYGDVDFIVGGDTEVESESSIVDHFGAALLDAEYYKSHHHGRFDGGSEKFLRAIRPRITLVPVSWKEYRGGWSEYVDESQPQFDRLARFRVNRFGIDDLPLFDRRQTASNHNITFATDGVSYEVRVEQALQPAKAFDPHAHDDCDHGPRPQPDAARPHP
jgi:competence protein ComEC